MADHVIPGAFITHNRHLEGFEVTKEDTKKMFEEIMDKKERYPDLTYDNIINTLMLLEMKRKNAQDLWDGDARDEGFEGTAKILKQLGENLEGALGSISNDIRNSSWGK